MGKIILANSKTKESLKFPGIPFYVPNPMNSTEKSIHTDELEIAKAISIEAESDGFLYGLNSEEKKQTDDFLKHIVNDLKYDVKSLLPELNENLKFSTFINDKYTLSMCDLFCFALIISEFNQEKDDIKLKYANVSRWANYIENLYGISSVCKKIGLWFNLPFVPLFLEFEKYTKNEKKEKKKEENKEEKKRGEKRRKKRGEKTRIKRGEKRRKEREE